MSTQSPKIVDISLILSIITYNWAHGHPRIYIQPGLSMTI